jgi:hypothetical protein
MGAAGFKRYPLEVKRFLENAAMCEHFAGEEGYDAERGQYILQELERYCGDARKAALVLRKNINMMPPWAALSPCARKEAWRLARPFRDWTIIK